jgi:hypothetical protein
MAVRHLPTLLLAAALIIDGAFSAAARTGSPRNDLEEQHHIQVTLKSGQSFLIPLPVTAYPGAPVQVNIADPSFASRFSWLMRNTISYAHGAISCLCDLNYGRTIATTVTSGNTQEVNSLSNENGEIGAVLEAVPVGSTEGLQLTVPAASGTKTFEITIFQV